MFKSYPITGVGVGMFEKLMHDEKYKISWDTPTALLHAHSTYIEVLSELGLLGFLAFIFIFVRFFMMFFGLVDMNFDTFRKIIMFGLFGSVIASLILALTSTTLILGLQDAVMFWLLFGVAVGLVRDKNKETVSL
jgi:O-antigen ligase